MKPEWAVQEVYNHFDAFLQISIVKDDSYITNNPGIFTINNLDQCVALFVDNPDTGEGNFDSKSKGQFSTASNEVKELFAHFIWLWSLSTSDMRAVGKKSAVMRFLGEEYNTILNSVFIDGGIGSAGQRHKINKPFEIAYLILLFREIKNKVQAKNITDNAEIKKITISLCKELYYNNEKTIETNDERLRKASYGYLALHHILLHLCDPESYESIAAQKHKDAIISTFFSLLDKENTDGLWDDIDETILLIRKKLDGIFGYEISFYDKEIQNAWDFGESKDDLSEVTLFEYKKALIFYGPPGTSKTHSAQRLAELLITKQYFRNKKDIKKYFENSKVIFDEHIHHLQLHANYNYEDFIVGLHIEDKSSVVKPGFLLKLIDKIKSDQLPHVLILDEINRTDISRLFGELFSALEYRNKKIKLSMGEALEIALPENLYFIGTMNEIDFSLERVDFALRRRFLWQFKGFDPIILLQIMEEKMNTLKITINDEEIEIFIKRCEKLNYEVSKMPELGENYQIGHTFFAEVVDVFKSFKTVHSGRLKFLNQPPRILWEISIKPVIMAFFGNMDAESKNEKVKQLETVFFGG